MIKETNTQPFSGYGILALCMALLAGAIAAFILKHPAIGMLQVVPFIFLLRGFVIINPNEACVLVLLEPTKAPLKPAAFIG